MLVTQIKGCRDSTNQFVGMSFQLQNLEKSKTIQLDPIGNTDSSLSTISCDSVTLSEEDYV